MGFAQHAAPIGCLAPFVGFSFGRRPLGGAHGRMHHARPIQGASVPPGRVPTPRSRLAWARHTPERGTKWVCDQASNSNR
jgi:hypothetical protein